MDENRFQLMVTFISHSEEETKALAYRIATSLRPRTVIGLWGDLGAGKTTFVKGIADALGVKTRVTSPSFVIVNWYLDGVMPLYHLDLYRIESPQDLISAGVYEYLPPTNGLTVVEWADRVFGDFTQNIHDLTQNGFLLVPVKLTNLNGSARQIEYVDPSY